MHSTMLTLLCALSGTKMVLPSHPCCIDKLGKQIFNKQAVAPMSSLAPQKSHTLSCTARHCRKGGGQNALMKGEVCFLKNTKAGTVSTAMSIELPHNPVLFNKQMLTLGIKIQLGTFQAHNMAGGCSIPSCCLSSLSRIRNQPTVLIYSMEGKLGWRRELEV